MQVSLSIHGLKFRKMKKAVYLIMIIISIESYSQRIRTYVGCSAYLDTDFKSSVFADLKGGAEYKVVNYFRPEIEISATFGALEDVTHRDSAGYVVSQYSKEIFAMNYSFCPKFILGNEDGDGSRGYLQILPKYTYSNIQASGSLVSTASGKLVQENSKVYDNQHSFGIGLGYAIDFSNETSNSLVFNIYFNNIDFGQALNDLIQDDTYTTRDVIGFGVNYYFTFRKQKQ